jgi:hypothetical protein
VKTRKLETRERLSKARKKLIHKRKKKKISKMYIEEKDK